ncbi:alpha/beta fold hydrolase [uncultured Microbulbifer sp.]|uniref:alpha/beta fold hydrolase n=1 Tax=uncultured Microbulbifer sp. TaxID=348147 RepID=UPI0026173850|nr:alpha/beta fold hydrolase [uncultured Microbulbifer sp.]
MRFIRSLVATILAISVLSATAREDHPESTGTQVYANETPITFTANDGQSTEALSGHFWVPENRNNPQSRKIRINYVRFAATGDVQGPPTVYLAGGPGGSGIGTAKWRRFPLFMAMREFGDVIALDQRGTGESEQAPGCDSSVTFPLDKAVSEKAFILGYQQAARECLARWREQGIDVYGYTTVQNAWDINDLRQHLNARQVNLWGISYGSHLALAAMKLFPEQINKVILASAEGLNQTVKLPAHTDAYFARVQQVIDQQPLKSAVADLPALIKRVHQRLHKTPLKLAIPKKDGSEQNMLFQAQHMQALAGMMIADPNQYLAMLIHTYNELDKGKTRTLIGVLQRGIFDDKPVSFRLMSLSMDVASGITPARLKLVAQQAESSLLGSWLNFPMPTLNRLDAKLDLGDAFRSAPQSSIPTLLFTGTLDGRTYPEGQKTAVRGLSNLTQVKVVHGGHNLFMSSPAVLENMQFFMQNKALRNTTITLPLPKLSL